MKNEDKCETNKKLQSQTMKDNLGANKQLKVAQEIEDSTTVANSKEVAIYSEGDNLQGKVKVFQEEKKSLEIKIKQLEGDRDLVIKERQKLWDEFQKFKITVGEPHKKNDITDNEKTLLEVKIKELQEERSQIVKDRQKLWEEYQKIKVIRDDLRERLNAKEAEEKATKEVSVVSEKLLEELEQKNILISQLSISIEDQKKQNELILFQVHQTKDDINKYWSENVQLKQTNANLQSRWTRLQAKFPDYVDYGSIQIVSDYSLAEEPQLVWKVSDFLKDDISFAEFYFTTTLADGNIGISLFSDLADKSSNPIFIPSRMGSLIEQSNLYYGFTRDDWKRLLAAALILEQINFNASASIPGGEGVDFGFWRGSLKALIAQIKDLRPTVRFNEIKLKRELKNPDYEHLWLEFSGVDFNGLDVPKLELRLGAAMIQPDGFSRHPKLEFPLTDGKHKPFESWFAETQDDFGAKYELRFDLDKVAFDYTTWLKIAEKDRLFLEELIIAVPSSLQKLKDKQVSVSRNWKIWIDFANELVQIFNKQLILIKGRLGSNQGSLSNQANQNNQINRANGVPRSASNPLPNSSPKQQQAKEVFAPSVLPTQGNAFQTPQYSEIQEYQQNVPPLTPGRVSTNTMVEQPSPLMQGATGVKKIARGGTAGSISAPTGAGAQISYRELSSTMSVTVTRKASVSKAEKPSAVKKKTTTSTPAKKRARTR